MSSETSTETVRLKPAPDQSLQPWQFFVLAALSCATLLTFMVRGEGLAAVILLTLVMGATALVGLAALKAIRPLVTDHEDRTLMIGERTRTALEREKMLALRAIKELEFDHAMGKIAPDDFRDMEARLRARALRLMRQLDAGAGYRERIERDLLKRLGEVKGPKPESKSRARATGSEAEVTGPARRDNLEEAPAAEQTCAGCSTANDPDARFCKACGQPL
jgi:hypothetical protein